MPYGDHRAEGGVSSNGKDAIIAAAMIFTAPRKALRILGAPRSPHAVAFELPEHLWGEEADLAFHRIEPAAGYEKHGKPMPLHRIFHRIGNA